MRSAQKERHGQGNDRHPLEEELVQKIEGTDARLEVLYDHTLLPPPRYPSDHKGEPGFRRDPAGERRWEEMLESAEVLFGIPGDSPEMLREVVRRATRWSGSGYERRWEQVRVAGLSPRELDRVIVTTSSGIRRSLAEFCLFGLLAFTKGLPRLLRDKQEKRWDHYPTRELKGTTILAGPGQHRARGRSAGTLLRDAHNRTQAPPRHGASSRGGAASVRGPQRPRTPRRRRCSHPTFNRANSRHGRPGSDKSHEARVRLRERRTRWRGRRGSPDRIVGEPAHRGRPSTCSSPNPAAREPSVGFAQRPGSALTPPP